MYWQDLQPGISDAEYDRLVAEWVELTGTVPLHLVAAFLRIADPAALPANVLSFVAFDILSPEATGILTRQSEAVSQLEQWGFSTPYPAWPEVPADQVMQRVLAFGSLRSTLDFPTDGLVIKVEQRRLQQAAGSTAQAPRWAAAWKYPGETATSEILDIVESVGETGKITPVALIRTVQIDGVTVNRVSLHNPGFVEQNALKPGKVIRLHLSGGIIPAVLITPTCD